MQPKDMIITELVTKKKQLLDRLLAHSIQSVLNTANPDAALEKRAELLSMLELNDKAILTREQQTGHQALTQEKRLYAEIGSLINAIQDNNQLTLVDLESAVKASEQEKQNLGKEKRIGNYVRQTKSYSRLGNKPQSSGGNKTKLVNGTL